MTEASINLVVEGAAGLEYQFWGEVPVGHLTGGPPGRGSCC